MREEPRPTSPIRRRWHVLGLVLLTLLMALPGLSGLPLIDRDEARYVQSSVQMAESGDWVEIRLGDAARNKKPVGAYWAQAASIMATGGLEDRPGRTLFVQRLPSVVAGVLAVLLTYLAAIPMIGRRGAVLAAAMLATSLIFVFEAHIAKTDALLLAATTGAFAALARLRAGRARGMAFLFWGALGASVLIKGPVGPGIAALCLVTLFAWERRAAWARPLLNPLALLLFFAIWLPWLVAIGLATDGQFFADSLGRDFGGKLAGAAENHGGPPGYYALTVFLSLWPAVLFLLPGLAFAWQASRRGGNSLPARGMRLCLAWAVPFWLVLEVVPTKLIHYPLPLFPALCAAMAGAALAIGATRERGDRSTYVGTRWVSGLLFIVSTAAVLGVVLYVQSSYGDDALDVPAYILAAAAGALALAGAVGLFLSRMGLAVISAGLAAIVMSTAAYGVLAPRVDAARLSERLAAAPAPLLSPHYTETSLLFYAGRDHVRLGDDADVEDWAGWTRGTLILDTRANPRAVAEVTARAGRDGICLRETGRVAGINYSRGEEVDFVLLRQTPCAPVSAP